MTTAFDILVEDQVQLSLEMANAKPGAITFPVVGKAATKGSSRIGTHPTSGKAIVLADNRNLKAWTYQVQWSARANRIPLVARPGAVGVRIWFLFERPKSAPATGRPFMTVKPDIDKVLRAALDALTGIAYEDDAQVVEVQTIKRYSARTETILQIWEER